MDPPRRRRQGAVRFLPGEDPRPRGLPARSPRPTPVSATETFGLGDIFWPQVYWAAGRRARGWAQGEDSLPYAQARLFLPGRQGRTRPLSRNSLGRVPSENYKYVRINLFPGRQGRTRPLSARRRGRELVFVSGFREAGRRAGWLDEASHSAVPVTPSSPSPCVPACRAGPAGSTGRVCCRRFTPVTPLSPDPCTPPSPAHPHPGTEKWRPRLSAPRGAQTLIARQSGQSVPEWPCTAELAPPLCDSSLGFS